MATEHVFHVALAADWAAAREAGDYRVSSLGRTLAEEGFLHASYADQWPGVLSAYYADVQEPLVLLEIDPDLLDVPLVVEAPAGSEPGAAEFPHLYGPLAVDAVVAVTPLR